jgi:hypothetical protein
MSGEAKEWGKHAQEWVFTLTVMEERRMWEMDDDAPLQVGECCHWMHARRAFAKAVNNHFSCI